MRNDHRCAQAGGRRGRSARRPRASFALLLLFASVLAGCLGGGNGGGGGSDGDGDGGVDGTDGGTDGSDGGVDGGHGDGYVPPPCTRFDVPESDAYGYTAGLVTDASGEPRYRVPGEPGHAESACWLWNAMHADGWNVSWQNFTGADYLPLDKGEVSFYAQCTDAEEERLRELRFYNLVAHRPADAGAGDGEANQTRTLLLGAHWDSKQHASQDPDPQRRDDPVLGANDGASGVGVLLALQRALPALPFAITIVFFDAEDGFEDCHPLAGSIYHARTAAAAGTLPDRMILLDMVGDADARFVRESRSMDADPELVELIWSHGHNTTRAENFIETEKSVLDDHVPFLEEGVPAVDVIDFGRPAGEGISGFPPYWHTTGDTLDKLEAEMMQDMVAIIGAVLEDPAFVDGWPT